MALFDLRAVVWQSQPMGDAATWGLVIAGLALTAVLDLGLLGDGIYQVTTGRPSALGIERRFRKRLPATELDCVRQGAGKILQAAGLVFIMAPAAVTSVQSAAALTGLISSAPHAPPPPILAALVFAGLFGPPAAGLVLIFAAYGVTTRVKYVAVEPRALPTS